ncbi:MAG: ATP-dependent zinc metalloprotease FtsH [Clostridiales bacterium]|nr:ATP-dependent zinc metalloprotease FtsH [Clostridiales bacterium]
MNNKPGNPNPFRGIGIYLLIFATVIMAVWMLQSSSLLSGTAQVNKIDFSELVKNLEEDKVRTISVSESSRRYEGQLSDGSYFMANAPTAYDMAILSEKYLVPQSEDGGLTVQSIKPSVLSSILSWIPTIALVGLMIFFWMNLTGSAGGNRGMMNFGKNKAKVFKEGDTKVTFADVAGLDEEKAELEEIVDFLKNPKKYMNLGARIPKGVLLVGPPGTGKTYISKAVAGEAGVPFFSISGSDFVEMFVGVGASRVRDLFDEAKKNSPCIVFIDEIDAVGRRRGAGIGGGNDEREQTLNQLLVEMDGFGMNEGIIILAATNRPDVLDPAILRPGRFDRQVTIGMPDIKGREDVFKVHSKGKPLGDDVDIKVLAKRTPGFTPADIENMMNEAALLTARRNGTQIHMDDLEEAITRVIAGPKKRSRVMSDKEKRLTAYHEAGHAVVMRSLPGSDPVHQVTIMPRGSAGGFTMSLPEEDRYYMTRSEMKDRIKHLLGGRVAEAMVLDDISTGASNDLERVTKIAHDMVTKYGMSEIIGPINYSTAEEVFLGRDFTSKQNFSEELAAKIDREVHNIIDKAYSETEDILREHRAELDRIAAALLEMETLDAEQFELLYTDSASVEELMEKQKNEDEARRKKEKAESAKRAAMEAEEKKRREAEMVAAMDEGKRIAVLDENGRIVIKDASELRRQMQENEDNSDGGE